MKASPHATTPWVINTCKKAGGKYLHNIRVASSKASLTHLSALSVTFWAESNAESNARSQARSTLYTCVRAENKIAGRVPDQLITSFALHPRVQTAVQLERRSSRCKSTSCIDFVYINRLTSCMPKKGIRKNNQVEELHTESLKVLSRHVGQTSARR